MTVLVYVDDLILDDNHSHSCIFFKAFLNEHFNIKDLGSLKYLFGIEVAYSNVGLFFLPMQLHNRHSYGITTSFVQQFRGINITSISVSLISGASYLPYHYTTVTLSIFLACSYMIHDNII